MSPEPIYTTENVKFAYQLNWSLAIFWRSVPPPWEGWFDKLREQSEGDGVRILEMSWPTERSTLFLVSTNPDLKPEKIPWSVKGRLQYLIRSNQPAAFQRNFDLRSIGSTTREKVEAYVASQLSHHSPYDPVLRARFADLQFVNQEVDLKQPRFSEHARFWCNLHLVFVRDWREPELNLDVWIRSRSLVRAAAEKHQHLLSRLAILPDHVHMVLGTRTNECPKTVALSYLNNLAYAQGMRPMFMRSCFVGTVGEYDLGAIK
jgi:REP element-mobilizing transposase RayT